MGPGSVLAGDAHLLGVGEGPQAGRRRVSEKIFPMKLGQFELAFLRHEQSITNPGDPAAPEHITWSIPPKVSCKSPAGTSILPALMDA